MQQAGLLVSTRRPLSDRIFYSSAAGIILVLTFVGFQPYYLRGQGFGDRTIAPEMFWWVLVHGGASSAWVALFLAQSWLIAARNRRLHMKLGWSAVVIAGTTAGSGVVLAVLSVRLSPNFVFWGMEYSQFLLVMLMEMFVFAGFVTVGLWFRRRPGIHRSMLLLASLSILAGATVRMPVFIPVFGDSRWPGIFGPIFALGAVLLVVRCAVTRSLDRSLAAGYAVLVVLYVAAGELALTAPWQRLAQGLLEG